MTSDEQAVVELSKGWLEANDRGDTGWLRENLTADYYMHNANGSHYSGIDHICELWDYYRTSLCWDGKGSPDKFVCTMVEPIRAEVHGDFAWVGYRFTAHVEPIAEGWLVPVGQTMDALVNATDVCRREGGRWKICCGP